MEITITKEKTKEECPKPRTSKPGGDSHGLTSHLRKQGETTSTDADSPHTRHTNQTGHQKPGTPPLPPPQREANKTRPHQRKGGKRPAACTASSRNTGSQPNCNPKEKSKCQNPGAPINGGTGSLPHSTTHHHSPSTPPPSAGSRPHQQVDEIREIPNWIPLLGKCHFISEESPL